MQSRIEQLLITVEAYCKATGRSESRVSTLIFNGGSRLKQLRDGKDMGVRILEDGLRWLSENWPDGAEWPVSVPRPSVSSAEGAA